MEIIKMQCDAVAQYSFLTSFKSYLRTGLAALLIGFVPLAMPSFAQNEKVDEEAQHQIEGTNAAGSFLAARIADAEFDFQTASKLLEDAISFAPEDENLKRSLMVTALQAGQFDVAVSLAEDAIRDEISGRVARHIMFVSHMRSKKYNAALGLLSIEPVEEDMALELLMDRMLESWAVWGQGDQEAALEILNKEPEHAWYPLFTDYQAGLIFEQVGDLPQAIKQFEAVVNNPVVFSTAPELGLRAVTELIELNIGLGRYDEVESLLDKAFKTAANYEPFVQLALKFEALDREAEPAEFKPFVESVQQGVAETFYVLAKAINRPGSETFVSQLYRLAIALAPENADLRIAMGDLLDAKNRYEEANAQYEAVDENSTHKTAALIQQAINFNAMENNDQAESTLQAALERDPDSVNAALALSSILMNEERPKDALSVLNKSIKRIDKLDRTHWILLYRRAIAFDELNQWEEAESDFLAALELFPDQPDVLNYLGYTWVDMGINLDRGLEMIETAVERRPDAGYIVDSLGWAFYRLENYEEAVVHLQRAAEITPNDPTIIDHLGDAYWQVGRKLEARYKWAQALEFDPDETQKANIEEKIEQGLTIKFLQKDTERPAAQ